MRDSESVIPTISAKIHSIARQLRGDVWRVGQMPAKRETYFICIVVVVFVGSLFFGRDTLTRQKSIIAAEIIAAAADK